MSLQTSQDMTLSPALDEVAFTTMEANVDQTELMLGHCLPESAVERPTQSHRRVEDKTTLRNLLKQSIQRLLDELGPGGSESMPCLESSWARVSTRESDDNAQIQLQPMR